MMEMIPSYHHNDTLDAVFQGFIAGGFPVIGRSGFFSQPAHSKVSLAWHLRPE